MYFFDVILFYEDVFLSFLNRQCIYSMLFANVSILWYSNFLCYSPMYLFYSIRICKDIFNMPIIYFFYAIIYFQQRYIFNFLNRQCIPNMPILFSFQLSKPSPFTPGVCHADTVCHAWQDCVAHPPARAPGVWGQRNGIIPIACISKYVIERTMAKCKLYQQIKRHFWQKEWENIFALGVCLSTFEYDMITI